MSKSADAFRTISEVADWLNTPAHVLRFWESKFSQVKPVKRAGGRRYYRPNDMKLLGGIKKLLHEDGMTIKGVQKLLREKGVGHVAELSQPLGDAADDVEVVESSPMAVIDGSVSPAPTVAPSDDQAAPPAEVAASPDTPSDLAEEQPVSETVQTAQTPEDPASSDKATDATHVADTADEPETIGFRHAARQESLDLQEQDANAAPTTASSPDAQDVVQSSPAEDATPLNGTMPEPVADTDARKPAIVEVPDDPDDHALAVPGVLSKLAALPQPISPSLAAELRPLLEKLRSRANTEGKS